VIPLAPPLAPLKPLERFRPAVSLPGLIGLCLATNLSAAPRDGGVIRHVEPARIERFLPAPTKDGAASPRRLEFEAHGRRFELELESNEAILGRLPPERRRALPPRALYKGRLVGQAGSWVRLTMLQDGLHGLVHDGRELYLLAPAGRVKGRLLTPVAAAARETLMFRAADADGSGGSCTTVDPAAGQPATQALAYESLGRELGALRSAPVDLAADTVGRELQIAIVGDNEFSARRADPDGDLLALVNAADGIFAAQAGVTVTATEVRAFRDVPDPFNQSDPRDLLDEVADYRNSTPSIRATDVAHLATGRDLAGTTVGIAYRGTVCDPRNAVSLSEQYDPSAGYLIFAHELGHNLGAPHDGETGSACSFEPRSYLMAPSVNFSSRLSACSVEQIQGVVEAATCLAIAPADGLVSLVGSNLIGAFTTQQVSAQFEVLSAGGETLRGARLEMSTGGLAVLGASVPLGSCTTSAATADCSLGDLPPGAARTIELRIDAGSAPGQYPLSATLSAANDAKSTNNVREATIRVQPGAAVQAVIQSSSAVIQIGSRGQATATVRNIGVIALSGLNVEVESSKPALAIDAIVAPGATCTRSSPQRWRCSYAETLVPGGSYALEATLLGVSFDRATLTVQPLLPQVGTATAASTEVSVKPFADVGLVDRTAGTPSPVEGQPFELSLAVQVNGIDTAHGVVLRGVLPETFRLRRITGTDSCSVIEGQQLRCTLGDLVPSTFQLIRFELEASAPGTQVIPFEVSAVADDIPVNNAIAPQVIVAADVDLGVSTATDLAPLKVGRSVDWGFTVTTTRRPVPGASLRFTVGTADLAIESVATPTGTCTVAAAAADCALGDLPPDASLSVALRVRGIRAGTSILFASVAGPLDADYSNQALNRQFNVLPVGDAGVRAEAVAGQPRQGQSFDLQAFTVTAQRATEQVALDLTLPASVRVESATVPGGACTIESGSVRCALGDLTTADKRRLDLRIVPAEVGTLTIAARVRSSDDDDASNDAATLPLNVTTVVVQPPAGSGGSGGGGGGGALGPGWLLLLFGGLAARPRGPVRA
jgi:hypothetical protein